MTIVNLSNGDGSQKPPSVTTTDVLIIGTGPAGASLACFLASYGEFYILRPNEKSEINSLSFFLGIRGIMVSSCPTNADTPRAHITNMAAMGKQAPLTGRPTS